MDGFYARVINDLLNERLVIADGYGLVRQVGVPVNDLYVPKLAILSLVCCLKPVRIATARIITASPSAIPMIAITLIGREKAVSWLRSLIRRRAMNVPVDIGTKLRIKGYRSNESLPFA
jgi:hypothetical protein